MIELANPDYRIIVEKLNKEGQGHVFHYWNELSEISRKKLIDQLKKIDFDLLQKLKKQISSGTRTEKEYAKIEPAEAIPVPSTPEERSRAFEAGLVGEALIRAGKLGIFLVAGGQGTRLDFFGPKGCFPVSPVMGKSLFQLHAEKILAANRKYGVSIPWCIMTSESNDHTTRDFFAEHHFFGLDSKDVHFIEQEMMPALDVYGKLILDAKDHVFTSPNGHGGSLSALYKSGILDMFKKRGIEILSYFQVDNVLAKMIDPVFIGYHIQAQADMSSKMVKKRNPMEKLGIFCLVDGKLRVVEYSDMTEENMNAKNPDGSLRFQAGSIAVHMINLMFVEIKYNGRIDLPYHIACKKIPTLYESGTFVIPSQPNGYKFEMFIFDALKDANRSIIMEVLREEEFSPVKNRTGEDSPETAARDMSRFFACWLEKAGIHLLKDDRGNVKGYVEISPLFAIDRDEFLRQIPQNLTFDGSLYLGPV
jgi:UDP-N-acetylglucosamine/UDP-N-acetylgalactosamine diphosphorylase